MALFAESTIQTLPEVLVVFGTAFLIIRKTIDMERFSTYVAAEEVLLVAEGAT